MKLKSITTAGNQNIELARFVILVGPHNSGKSQSLGNIRDLIVGGQRAITGVKLVESLTFEKPSSFEEMIRGIDFLEVPGRPEQVMARSLSPNFAGQESTALDRDKLRQFYDHFEEAEGGGPSSRAKG
jgi:hypothetical protein